MVRFIAVGDTGKGNEGQRQVAAAMKNKCDAAGCDFVVLLGDNIYESGVTSVTDMEWQTRFETPYADIDLPFWAVLGNHDYGGIPTGGLGNQFTRGPVEVAYSQVSSKWRMPDTHYTLTAGPAGFLALDTNSIFWDNTSNGDQGAWVGPALAGLNTPWRIAIGHHPYLSNGPHGNAGSYDNIPCSVLTNAPCGKYVRDFFDEHICGNVDIYLSGHDHSRQWLHSACGAELIVSGAGASPTDLSGDNPVYWEQATLGFLYAVVDETTFTGEFIDANGVVQFERIVTRTP